MARGMPIAEQSIATNGVTSVTPWTEARDRFAEANRYWLATVRPDGRPHVMLVFGVWLGDALYFTAARTSCKSKNLALNARCVIAEGGLQFPHPLSERQRPLARSAASSSYW